MTQLHITDLTAEGQGVGRDADGLAWFVPNALPGERIHAREVTRKKGYVIGELADIITPSPDRITPACPHFGRCGGCTLQHMAYPAQVAWKGQRVAQTLRRIGGFADPPVAPAVASPDAWRYRNKAQFPCGGTAQTPTIGLYLPRSHRVCDVPDCLLQHPACAPIMQAVRQHITDHNIAPYHEATHRGVLRHVLLRNTPEGSSHLLLVCTTTAFPAAEQLFHAVQPHGVTGLSINLNTRTDNVVLGRKTQTLCGEATLPVTVGGHDFALSPTSFLQVNPNQFQALYQIAADALPPGAKVLELYCGIGTLTLMLAKKAAQVTGVELLQAAIDDATRAAAQNNISNVTYIAADAAQYMAQTAGDFDTVVLDPPRRGCDDSVLTALLTHRPTTIIYISCNPATLARDAKTLSQHYHPTKITPVDMFPQTGHVETVMVLARKGALK